MAKLWTRGYDVYSPEKVLVMHDDAFEMRGSPSKTKQGPHKPSVFREWSSNGQTPEYKRIMFDDAITRVKTLLDMEGGLKADRETLTLLQQYGLGTKRTLDQFMQFTGVDTRQGALFAEPCSARQWLPFKADSHAELLDGDVWGLSAEVAVAGSSDIPLLAGGDVELFNPANAESAGDAEAASEGDVTIDVVQRREVPNPLQEYPFLWSLFLPVDSIVEAAIGSIDGFDGNERPHAVRNVKLLLLFLPCVLLLVVVALYTVMGKQVSAVFGPESENFEAPHVREFSKEI